MNCTVKFSFATQIKFLQYSKMCDVTVHIENDCVAGRQYDKNGNLRQWWNDDTITAFRQRAQCMTEQYSRTKLQPFGLYVCTGLSATLNTQHLIINKQGVNYDNIFQLCKLFLFSLTVKTHKAKTSQTTVD